MSPVLSQFVVPVTSVHKVQADGVEVFYRAAFDRTSLSSLVGAEKRTHFQLTMCPYYVRGLI